MTAMLTCIFHDRTKTAMRHRFAFLALSALACFAGLSAAAPRAQAEIAITLGRGQFQPLPIAIADFTGTDPELGRNIAAVITADLKRSGVFLPIDKAAFIEKAVNPDVAPKFDSWKVINAQALVTGKIVRDPSGRLKAEFRLWDVFAGQQLTGQQYFTDPNNWRRVAHIIADAIYSRLTGEKGFFDSRIVFRSMRRAQRTSASRNWRSWIQMARMCVI